MFNFTNRQAVAFCIAMLIAGCVTIWGISYGVNHYWVGQREDPLAKTGGLNSQQKIAPK
jgi:hypothetical protein